MPISDKDRVQYKKIGKKRVQNIESNKKQEYLFFDTKQQMEKYKDDKNFKKFFIAYLKVQKKEELSKKIKGKKDKSKKTKTEKKTSDKHQTKIMQKEISKEQNQQQLNQLRKKINENKKLEASFDRIGSGMKDYYYDEANQVWVNKNKNFNKQEANKDFRKKGIDSWDQIMQKLQKKYSKKSTNKPSKNTKKKTQKPTKKPTQKKTTQKPKQ